MWRLAEFLSLIPLSLGNVVQLGGDAIFGLFKTSLLHFRSYW